MGAYPPLSPPAAPSPQDFRPPGLDPALLLFSSPASSSVKVFRKCPLFSRPLCSWCSRTFWPLVSPPTWCLRPIHPMRASPPRSPGPLISEPWFSWTDLSCWNIRANLSPLDPSPLPGLQGAPVSGDIPLRPLLTPELHHFCLVQRLSIHGSLSDDFGLS